MPNTPRNAGTVVPGLVFAPFFRFLFTAGAEAGTMPFGVPLLAEFDPALPDPFIIQPAAVIALILTFCAAGLVQAFHLRWSW